MFCKVALTCLLCITAINARSIGNYNFPTYPTQNTNEFYPAAALPDYNPKLPAWQFRNEMPAQYEEFERLASQAYPYKLVNRVPKVEELTDFQELETQLAQEKQITQVADDVKSLQKTVSELEKYLKSAAAGLPPQNKAYNETIRISKKLPKHGEVHGEDSNESDGGEIEKELKDILKRVLVVHKTDGDIGEMEKELENLIYRILEYKLKNLILFGEDSNESDSGEMEKGWDNLFSNILGAVNLIGLILMN